MNQAHEASAYGLWSLVILNSAIFLIFAFSFFKPQTKRDWRTFGTFAAFIVALFVEMYGFPLTIYLLYGWLAQRYPNIDPLSHEGGHLWYTLFGLNGDPHSNPVHLLSNVIIIAGFFLLSAAWRVLYQAHRTSSLATSGPYARIRHPQYVAFIVIMFGFLLQWPTLVTVLMFPILTTIYVRLARREEREVSAAFGAAWQEYAARTPRFFPRIRRLTGGAGKRGAHA